MKGLILALRGATRSLSGRDATCATLARGRRGGRRRQGRVGGSGAHRIVVSGGDDVRGRDARAARLAATTAEHVRFLHGDSWVDRLREERDARRDGAPTRPKRRLQRLQRLQPRRTLTETKQRHIRRSSPTRSPPSCARGRRGNPRGSSPAWIPDTRRAVRGEGGDAAFGGASRRSRAVCRPQARRDVHPRGRRKGRRRKKKARAPAAPRTPSWRRTYLKTSPRGSPRTYRALRSGRRGVTARWVWTTTTASTSADDEGGTRATRPCRGEGGVRRGVPDASAALGRGGGRGGRGGDRAARGLLAAAARRRRRRSTAPGLRWDRRRDLRRTDAVRGVVRTAVTWTAADVDAFGTLAEVFDAQRRDRELAGAAGDGPSFG